MKQSNRKYIVKKNGYANSLSTCYLVNTHQLVD